MTTINSLIYQKLSTKLSQESLSQLIQLPSGLIGYLNSTKTAFILVGCELCILHEISQNAQGHPQINNKNLLTAEEMNYKQAEYTPEIWANLYFCPNCKTPIQSLLPHF